MAVREYLRMQCATKFLNCYQMGKKASICSAIMVGGGAEVGGISEIRV